MVRSLCKLLLIAPFIFVAHVLAETPKDWGALYKSGKLNTPYIHYSTIADGVASPQSKEFGASEGPAFLGMKIWASSPTEAIHMTKLFARRANFAVNGKIQVYRTKPSEPPRPEPHAYAIKFTPYDHNKK